jgi:hypothetical protein
MRSADTQRDLPVLDYQRKDEEMSRRLSTHEGEGFPPPAEFAALANVTESAYAEGRADRLGFWAEQARRLRWERPWRQVLDWSGAPLA